MFRANVIQSDMPDVSNTSSMHMLDEAEAIVTNERRKLDFIGAAILYTTPWLNDDARAQYTVGLFEAIAASDDTQIPELMSLWTKIKSNPDDDQSLLAIVEDQEQVLRSAENNYLSLTDNSRQEGLESAALPDTQSNQQPKQQQALLSLERFDPLKKRFFKASALLANASQKIGEQPKILDISQLTTFREEIDVVQKLYEGTSPNKRKIIGLILSAILLPSSLATNTPETTQPNKDPVAMQSINPIKITEETANSILHQAEKVVSTPSPLSKDSGALRDGPSKPIKITKTAKEELTSMAETGKLDEQPVTPTLRRTIKDVSQLPGATIANISETVTSPVASDDKITGPAGPITAPKPSEQQTVTLKFTSLADEKAAILNILNQGADTLITNPKDIPGGLVMVDGQTVSSSANIANPPDANSIIVSINGQRNPSAESAIEHSIRESNNKPEVPINPNLNQAQLDIIDNLSLSDYQKVFLENIAHGVINAVNQGAKINAAVVIAQGILESGWGNSLLASVYHNPFGMKAGTTWTGPTVTLPTEEFYNGQYVSIMAQWKVFPNYTAAIQDYASMMTEDPYFTMSATCSKTPLEYLTALQYAVNNNCQKIGSKPPYATDPEYINSILNVIKNLDIEQIVDAQ